VNFETLFRLADDLSYNKGYAAPGLSSKRRFCRFCVRKGHDACRPAFTEFNPHSDLGAQKQVESTGLIGLFNCSLRLTRLVALFNPKVRLRWEDIFSKLHEKSFCWVSARRGEERRRRGHRRFDRRFLSCLWGRTR